MKKLEVEIVDFKSQSDVELASFSARRFQFVLRVISDHFVEVHLFLDLLVGHNWIVLEHRLACHAVNCLITLFKDVKSEKTCGNHLRIRQKFSLLLRQSSSTLSSYMTVLLLDHTERIHFASRSAPLFLHLEACDPDCNLFIRVALPEPEDVLIEDQVLRSKHLPLEVSSELLWFSDPFLVFELQ